MSSSEDKVKSQQYGSPEANPPSPDDKSSSIAPGVITQGSGSNPGWVSSLAASKLITKSQAVAKLLHPKSVFVHGYTPPPGEDASPSTRGYYNLKVRLQEQDATTIHEMVKALIEEQTSLDGRDPLTGASSPDF